jgi:hypothetical protein
VSYRGNQEIVAGLIANSNEFQITFEYRGDSGLTAVGGTTHRTYTFREPGARVTVDHRDALSLISIPLLRRVP